MSLVFAFFQSIQLLVMPAAEVVLEHVAQFVLDVSSVHNMLVDEV